MKCSTEWVETHEKELKQKAVLYVNSDGNGRGFLYAEGSHALEPLMDGIAKQVIDPQTHVSVFDRLKARQMIDAKGVEERKKV